MIITHSYTNLIVGALLFPKIEITFSSSKVLRASLNSDSVIRLFSPKAPSLALELIKSKRFPYFNP